MGKTSIVLRLFTNLIYIGNIVHSVTKASKGLKKKTMENRQCLKKCFGNTEVYTACSP